MNKQIYLDHAAATPLSPKVLAAMTPFFIDNFYNPSALYLQAKAVSKDVSGARSRIARHFGSRLAEVIFTAGGTEANNLAIKGIMSQYPGANIVVSAVEHESVLNPARLNNCKVAPVKSDGQVDVTELEKLIDDETVLVSVMYANNEVGTIQPIKQIASTLEKLRKRRKNTSNEIPLYFHTDACQASQYLDLHASSLGVDMMTINGGKIYGPKQSGALYVRAGVELTPQIHGGGQEFGIRSGTENVPAIMGLAVALDETQGLKNDEIQRLQRIQKLFINLLEINIPRIRINGTTKNRLPNNVHITIDGTDNERLIMQLDEAGILAAAGSACSASDEEPSHVLKAMGMTDEEARSSLRFTMGRGTTEESIRTTVDTLMHLVVK